jgi:flagellin
VAAGVSAQSQPIFAGDTLVINGIAIGAALATDDTASIDQSVATASSRAASAIAISAAINKKSDQHGVTATAEANVLRGTGFTATTAGATVNINNVSITVAAYTRNAVIDAINERSGQTGVVASAWGDGIELRAEDGRNIVIASDASTAANLGLQGVSIGTGTAVTDGIVHYASVSLSSDSAFTVERGNVGDQSTSAFAAFGFSVGTFGGKNTGTKVADIDISSQLGAQNAITAIDHALQDVNNAQARSGAFQNRLDAIVNILQESGENMSASRSRILDTDYATETTALAKAQIIQQAATAMLAQANQQQQSVLALLQ